MGAETHNMSSGVGEKDQRETYTQGHSRSKRRPACTGDAAKAGQTPQRWMPAHSSCWIGELTRLAACSIAGAAHDGSCAPGLHHGCCHRCIRAQAGCQSCEAPVCCQHARVCGVIHPVVQLCCGKNMSEQQQRQRNGQQRSTTAAAQVVDTSTRAAGHAMA